MCSGSDVGERGRGAPERRAEHGDQQRKGRVGEDVVCAVLFRVDDGGSRAQALLGAGEMRAGVVGAAIAPRIEHDDPAQFRPPARGEAVKFAFQIDHHDRAAPVQQISSQVQSFS